MKCNSMSCKNYWGSRADFCNVLGDLRHANCSLDRTGKCVHYSRERIAQHTRDYEMTYCVAADCINHCGISCDHYGFWIMGASPEIGVDGVCIHYLSDAIDASNEIFTPVCEAVSEVFGGVAALC